MKMISVLSDEHFWVKTEFSAVRQLASVLPGEEEKPAVQPDRIGFQLQSQARDTGTNVALRVVMRCPRFNMPGTSTWNWDQEEKAVQVLSAFAAFGAFGAANVC